MRGTRTVCAVHIPPAGIIPAYAGNTAASLPALGYAGDHPRVCGEHSIRLTLKLIRPGSSPRMRGTLKLIGSPPHLEAGSSPRMRGTLPHLGGRIEHHGIIPAYAGNTFRCCCLSNLRRDHPRVCGEHHFAYEKLIGKSGSSPRMRGTLQLDIELRGVCGIIPAYAGNTR